MKMTKYIVLASAIVLMMMTASTSAVSTVTLYSGDASNIVFDGVVSASEYPYQLSLTAIDGDALATVYFFHDGTNMYVGLVSATNGWIGFGMNTKASMIGGDFILTEAGDSGLMVYDAYSDSQAQPTADDNSKLIAANASVVDGKTNTEFKFPMASSDPEDINFKVEDSVYFFVAGGEQDKVNVEYHELHRIDPIKLLIEEEAGDVATLTLATEEESSFLPVFITSAAVLAVIPIIRRRN